MGDLHYLQSHLDLEFPLLSDPELTVIKAFGVLDEENRIAWPTIFIIAKDGRIRWRSISSTYKERDSSQTILEGLD